MDPIHPILPQQPNIPPVTRAPRVGRIDRDTHPDEDAEKRHPPERERRRDDAPDSGIDPDEGPHIDVCA